MSPPSTADCIINHNNASPDLQAASSLLDAGDKSDSAINLLLNTRLFTKSTDDDIEPIPLKWDSKSSHYKQRGPVVCNFYKKGTTQHNSIGAHSGCYSVYHGLAVAAKQLNPNFHPSFENTDPQFSIPYNKNWTDGESIVSIDPFGHLAIPENFPELAENVDIRPSIAITKAVLQLPDIQSLVKEGKLPVDGKIVLNKEGDVAISKIALDSVWYLPGIAKRFGISEEELRVNLFKDTNNMYPELITRPDIKTFLPPIGGSTVYIFGDPSYLSDSTKDLALRVHDSCTGSDVFASNICTCRPYLIFGIQEAILQAQKPNGVGMCVYFQKEGRSLGEITKYLVYNARKKYGDTADKYFLRTECIAGVRDMRFQQLMPDVLKWLGVERIHKMLSMSNMKYDAIIDAGITIDERIPIPDDMIPGDSNVEIDAKIHSGYFTTGSVKTKSELEKTQGKEWM
ncbi:putative GTP cyclohydrolase [Hanseniaspora opuntiae]